MGHGDRLQGVAVEKERRLVDSLEERTVFDEIDQTRQVSQDVEIGVFMRADEDVGSEARVRALDHHPVSLENAVRDPDESDLVRAQFRESEHVEDDTIAQSQSLRGLRSEQREALLRSRRAARLRRLRAREAVQDAIAELRSRSVGNAILAEVASDRVAHILDGVHAVTSSEFFHPCRQQVSRRVQRIGHIQLSAPLKIALAPKRLLNQRRGRVAGVAHRSSAQSESQGNVAVVEVDRHRVHGIIAEEHGFDALIGREIRRAVRDHVVPDGPSVASRDLRILRTP